MFQTKVVEKTKTHFVFDFFVLKSCRLYEIMWKKYCRAREATCRYGGMRIACWIPEATNTHSEHVIFIAFPLQQRLNDRASLLGCTYIDCCAIVSVLVPTVLITVMSSLSHLNAAR